jgi:hypothetical protein
MICSSTFPIEDRFGIIQAEIPEANCNIPMTFYTLDNAPIGQYDTVFRQSRLVSLAPVALMLASMALPIWLRKTHHLPAWFFYPVVCLFGLILLIFASALRKTFKPQNWLVRVKPDGLLIKFRSYLNTNFSTADRVIVFIKPPEIEAISSTSERLTTISDQNGVQIDLYHYLDIIFKSSVNLLELQRSLDEERNRKLPRAMVESRSLDFPVQLVDGRTLRIRWSSSNGYTTPTLRRALKILSSIAPIRPPQTLVKDFVTVADTDAANDARIRELALHDDRFAAMRLARKVYKCSQTEAHKRVDELLTTPDANSDKSSKVH